MTTPLTAEEINQIVDAAPGVPTKAPLPTRQTVRELLDQELEPIVEVVGGLLPEGLALMAAPPKIGKSFMCVRMSIDLANGDRVFGRLPCRQSNVLALFAEDGKRRLQSRYRKLLDGRPMPDNVTFYTEAGIDFPLIGMDDTFIEWLDQMIDRDGYDVVFIDTLAKTTDPATFGGKQPEYVVYVHLLGKLQQFVRERPGLAVMATAHTKKGRESDPLNRVIGSIGQAATVDTNLIIDRERGQSAATLVVVSRDIDDSKPFYLSYDSGVWRFAETFEELPLTVERLEVLQAIATHGAAGGTELATRMGNERTAVQHKLTKLFEHGWLIRHAGKYDLSEKARLYL